MMSPHVLYLLDAPQRPGASLCGIVFELATLLREKTALNRVCLSGEPLTICICPNGSKRGCPKLDLRCSRREKCPPGMAV
jgi:hypothetical protein